MVWLQRSRSLLARSLCESAFIISHGRKSRSSSFAEQSDSLSRWFTLTMSTGGIALLLSVQPHRFVGLNTIGAIVFVFDLALFLLLTSLILARFLLFPGTFTQSVYHPTEGLFIPVCGVFPYPILECIRSSGLTEPADIPPQHLDHSFRYSDLWHPLHWAMAYRYLAGPLLDICGHHVHHSSLTIFSPLPKPKADASINDAGMDPAYLPDHARWYRCCRNSWVSASAPWYSHHYRGSHLSRSWHSCGFFHV